MFNFKNATFGDLDIYYGDLLKQRGDIVAAMLHNQNEINKTVDTIEAL